MDRNRLSAVLGWFVFLAIVVAINWPYQYSTHRTTGPMGRIGVSINHLDGDFALPVIAGWPCHFYYHFDYGERQPKYSRWSYAALLGNLVLIVTTVLALVFYQRRRRYASLNQTGKASKESKRGQLSIADLVIATMVVAMPLGYWQLLKRRGEQELERIAGIDEIGNYARSAELPRFLEEHLPGPFVEACMRVTNVTVTAPDQQLLDGIMQLPHLKEFRIGGGDYALSSLRSLPNFRDLTVLQISGRELDVQTIQMVSQIERLRHLDLGRTNVSSSALTLLSELPRLRLLNLIGSGVRLDQIQHPICPQSLQVLCLPRPEPGHTDHLVVEGYPRLSQILCQSHDAAANSSVLEIEIRDCPEFLSLMMGGMQKVSIKLENLPMLWQIVSINALWQQRIAASESIPGELWVKSLQIDGAPNLVEFDFFVRDLEYLRFKNVPKLKTVGVASYRKFGDGSTRQEEFLSPTAIKAMVEGFAESDGPEKIDLAAVPLQGVDLGALAENPRIVSLDLSDSNTNSRDWETLREIAQLQSLNVSRNPGSNISLASLLEKFPNLQRLTCDNLSQSDFVIEGKDELETIFITTNVFGMEEKGSSSTLNVWNQQRIRLANLPKFNNTISIGPFSSHIELVNVPSLKGLTIHRPLSQENVLAGFRDLKTFAVGGKYVDDQLLQELSTCRSIQHLALVHASASWEEIGKLLAVNPILTLDLRGTVVDDQLLAQIRDVKQLEEVYLDDTGVTGKVLQSLAPAVGLLTLGINGAALTEAEIDSLNQFRNLKRLHLSGSNLTPTQLEKMLGRPRLKHLDLSGQPFGREHAQALLDARLEGLQFLALSGKEIDPQAVIMLLQGYPRLELSLPDECLPVELYSELLTRGRVRANDQGDSADRLWSTVFQMTQDPELQSSRPVEMIIQPWMFEPKEEVQFDAEF
ncbi:Leucine Rich repeats (2 copies) [Roseimaritima multifibrata]|uniref:Leucine Rich repeats (2 copies) n=1 Tax=Roseimaritima multifibrata TaxID=1930274 RepID=A0A517MFT1_9BACT|nr:hypothetical protein [Roseimaritima multifibrata]QDS93745.1 Leucine Rich repeats (2 copies) [Roseimaritima multifibrata]